MFRFTSDWLCQELRVLCRRLEDTKTGREPVKSSKRVYFRDRSLSRSGRSWSKALSPPPPVTSCHFLSVRHGRLISSRHTFNTPSGSVTKKKQRSRRLLGKYFHPSSRPSLQELLLLPVHAFKRFHYKLGAPVGDKNKKSVLIKVCSLIAHRKIGGDNKVRRRK